MAKPDSLVQPGDVLFIAEHPRLQAEARVLAARVKELQARHAEQRPVDLVKAAIIEEELAYARDQLARTQRWLDDLVVRSHTAGQLIVPAPQDLPGRFIKQGGVGPRRGSSSPHRAGGRRSSGYRSRAHPDAGVEIRLAERVEDCYRAGVARLVPSAVSELPHAALGSEGGGVVPVDPTDAEGVRTVQRVFQVDLSVPGRRV